MKKRLLIFIVAYNAEDTIEDVLKRIPSSLSEDYDTEVLIIDDSSKDGTFDRSYRFQQTDSSPFKYVVLFNPVNQGYGGNQKIGFHYAIEKNFDFVALVHGDGQYAPECLPDLVKPLADDEADAVFGSRMLTPGGAIRGGMPLYKLLGNHVLTGLQNWLLQSSLSEFHSGYRLYSTKALRRVPFYLNSNVFHFDTEIIIQFIMAGLRIKELPIPTRYGDEVCHVNGWKYALDVIAATAKARAQKVNLFYDPKYDCADSGTGNSHYQPKFGYLSPHTLAAGMIPSGSRVLDLGCARGYMGAELKKRGCRVTGVDYMPLAEDVELDGFFQHNLDDGMPPVDLREFDYILLLDVIEHLRQPEQFVAQLREACAFSPNIKVIVSTGNVAFILTRLALMAGRFSYGKRGILDLTHTRLFTFSSICRLFLQAGYDILEVRGTPVPFPLAVGEGRIARILLGLNTLLIRLRRSLFSFQSFLVVRPHPSLEYLLRQAHTASEQRLKALHEE